MRTLAPLAILVLALVSGCSAPQHVQPSAAGVWRVGGSTGAAFSSTSAGAFGDSVEYGAELAIGRFVSRRVLLEVAVEAAFSEVEVDGLPDEETSAVNAVGGFRYYFESEARSRPYLGLAAGISTYDVKGDGVDESDTSLAVVGRAGVETFLSSTVTLDFGVRLLHVFDREFEGVEDDVTQGAFQIGLAARF